MGKQQFKTLEFPLLSILSHKEYIIVSGGVSTENTSQNKIVVYHKNTILDEPLFVLKTGKDLIQNLSTNGKTDLISCTSGRFCIIYRVDNEKHMITEVSRFATDTDAQNANIFNSKGDVLITGGDDKNIKVWDIAEQENKVVVKKNKDISYHTDKILHLDISVDDTLVCSASNDNTCGIFEIQTGNLLKRISFSEETLDTNLRFSYCFFARDEKYMYTIQNPRNNESSYLTQWKIEDNYEPEKTIFLNKKAVTAACINDEGLFMGIGTEDGSTKIINTRHFEVDCGIQIHNTAVESVNFINDSRALASVCRDNSFYFLANVRPEGAFSKISKMWVAAMFIIYFLMFLYEKISPLWK